jgi:hypothetical protein
VQWYNGGGSAADNTKLKTDIRFAVKPTEKDASLKGIVTDGNNTLWVLFDNKDGKNDTIQRYTIARGTVNGVANTPTGLTLVNTLSLGTKLGSVTGVTLRSHPRGEWCPLDRCTRSEGVTAHGAYRSC